MSGYRHGVDQSREALRVRLFRPSPADGTFAGMSSVRRCGARPLGMLLVALLLAAPACFIFNRGNKATPAPAPAFDVPEGEIALSVTNHNYLDVVIYVQHDGVQTRVGMVTGSSSTVFFLPARLVGQAREIRLLGDAIGSDAVARTDVLVVQRGQYIEWTLETDLGRSSVGVF